MILYIKLDLEDVMKSVAHYLISAHEKLASLYAPTQTGAVGDWRAVGTADSYSNQKRYARQATAFATSPQLTHYLDDRLGRGAYASPLVSSSSPFVARIGSALVTGRDNLLGGVALGIKVLILGLTHLWAQLTFAAKLPEAGTRPISLDTEAASKVARNEVCEHLKEAARTYAKHVQAKKAQDEWVFVEGGKNESLPTSVEEQREAMAAGPRLHEKTELFSETTDSLDPQFEADVVKRAWPTFLGDDVPTSEIDFERLQTQRRNDPEGEFAKWRDHFGSKELFSEVMALTSQSVIGIMMTSISKSESKKATVGLSLFHRHWQHLTRAYPAAEGRDAYVRVDAVVSHLRYTEKDDFEPLTGPVQLTMTVPLGKGGAGTRLSFVEPEEAVVRMLKNVST